MARRRPPPIPKGLPKWERDALKELGEEYKRLVAEMERAQKAQERAIEVAGKKAISEASKALTAALNIAVKNAEGLAKQFALDAEEARALKQSLEAAQGAFSGAKGGAQALSFLGPYGAGIGALLGALAGGISGASLEQARAEVLRARSEFDRELALRRRFFVEIDRDIERQRAARRRTGRLG